MLRNALVFLVVPLLACNRTPEPDPTPVKTAPPAAASASAAASPTSRQLAWDPPSGWTRADNTSALRKATYKIPKHAEDTEQPELAISVAGGAVDANIDRWVQQFGEGAKGTLKKSTRRVSDYDVTIIELSGTYQGNTMPGAPQTGPRANYALLGAIVPLDAETRWFFKMIGPARSVGAARSDFDALVGSIRAQ